MSATKKRTIQGNGRRSVWVTGQGVASPSPHVPFSLYQSADARSLSLDASGAGTGDPSDASASQVARPRPVERLRSPEPAEHHGYPLRRTQLVTFNREKAGVTAELRELSHLLDVMGLGTDEDAALRDLERRFDQLVSEKVRIPPHARRPEDDRLRRVIDHLIDWKEFERENPTPHLLWGRIVSRCASARPRVYWLVGPDGVREQTGVLPFKLVSPYFLQLNDGDWFRAVVLEYPGRVEWVEPPTRSSDPTDLEVRRAAWEAIPRIVADKPNVWPLKGR
jgi:hypothetical protein